MRDTESALIALCVIVVFAVLMPLLWHILLAVI